MATDGLTMAVLDVRLATGPVSWGVDFADAPGNPRWQQVLDEIQRSRVDALELGPVGYLPEDPVLLHAALDGRGLTAVGSFVFEDLHDPSSIEHVLGIAERACRAISAAGGTVLVIIDRPSDSRAATAGQSHLAERLPAGLWMRMGQLIERVADIARKHGLRPTFHPHAGSYVEFADEIDLLLSDTDIGLCLDTGHSAYAGMPAHEAISTYAERIEHIHIKDINPRVLELVPSERLDFWGAIGAGVFCPVGAGLVDLRRVAQELEQIGYAGFVTIEQDRVAGTGTPLEDLHASVEVLHRAGIGASGREESS
jgi:inosose dehydratase